MCVCVCVGGGGGGGQRKLTGGSRLTCVHTCQQPSCKGQLSMYPENCQNSSFVCHLLSKQGGLSLPFQ